mmetsp:Transcript_48369/g.75384  ORF Transcript_48369/g.75384 Transcript_48369/m.75384 type:complete len:116 (+) Transcript_48369:676-1023(+)
MRVLGVADTDALNDAEAETSALETGGGRYGETARAVNSLAVDDVVERSSNEPRRAGVTEAGTNCDESDRAETCGRTGAEELVVGMAPENPTAVALSIPFGKTLLAELEGTVAGES